MFASLYPAPHPGPPHHRPGSTAPARGKNASRRYSNHVQRPALSPSGSTATNAEKCGKNCPRRSRDTPGKSHNGPVTGRPGRTHAPRTSRSHPSGPCGPPAGCRGAPRRAGSHRPCAGLSCRPPGREEEKNCRAVLRLPLSGCRAPWPSWSRGLSVHGTL